MTSPPPPQKFCNFQPRIAAARKLAAPFASPRDARARSVIAEAANRTHLLLPPLVPLGPITPTRRHTGVAGRSPKQRGTAVACTRAWTASGPRLGSSEALAGILSCASAQTLMHEP